MKTSRRAWLQQMAALSMSGLAGPALPLISPAHAETLAATPPFTPGKPIRIWDGKTGTTGGMFNAALQVPWRNRGGDWIDANGIEQGPTPYAIMAFGSKTTPTMNQDVDITALAKEWAAQGNPNSGAYLRVTNPVVVCTRRYLDPALRPSVVLISSTGAKTVVPCAACAVIATASNSGRVGEVVSLNSTTHLALQFDLPRIAFVKARLRLNAAQLYSSSCTVKVFELDQPLIFNAAEHATALGIAATRPYDIDIVKHPDVYYATDFTPKTDWRKSFFDPAPTDTTFQFDGPMGGVAAHSRYRAGSFSSGLSLKRHWSDVTAVTRNPYNNLQVALEIPSSEFLARSHLGCPEDLYFRYYFMPKPGYQCERQGKKLPGLAGQYGRWTGTHYAPIDGNGGSPTRGKRFRDPDGFYFYSGWSMRHHAYVGAYDDNPHASMVPLSYYAYHARMTGEYGDIWPWGNNDLGWCVLEEGKWYCFEHRVKVNTIAGPFDSLGNGVGQPDGIVQGWLNGVLVFDKRDVVLRHHPAIKIDALWLNHYHGGSIPAETDHPFAMANLVVARKYIGPMVAG